MSAIPSFSLKLDRAREHLQAFKEESAAWIKRKRYTIFHEPDPDPIMHPVGQGAIRMRLRVLSIAQMPDQLALMLGDCVHNLRSSLDHLALTLAQHHTPGMTDRQVEGSEFPIFYKGPMDTNSETKKIGCVAPAAQAIIKSLQPHLRGTNYRDDPLWQIHELDRIDKHRTLTVSTAVSMSPQGTPGVAVAYGHSGAGENVDYLSFFDVFDCEIKPDAVLARYSVIPLKLNQKVQVNVIVTPQVAFPQGDVAPLKPVVPTLNALCDFVRDAVIAPLSKFL